MANALIQNPVDRENHIVHGVKVLGFTSANGRIYDFAAVKEAIQKYEKAPVNKDHNMEEPSFSDRLGWLENVTLQKDGLYADFHYNPHAEGIESFLWFAEHNGLGDVGFSHLVSGKYSVDPDGTERITRIDKVKSVDLVANPATTKTIFESEVKPMGKKIAKEAGNAANKAKKNAIDARIGKDFKNKYDGWYNQNGLLGKDTRGIGRQVRTQTDPGVHWDKLNKIARGEQEDDSVEEARAEPKPTLTNQRYWNLSDYELKSLAKDAREASARVLKMGDMKNAMRYDEQNADAATVLGYRQRNPKDPIKPEQEGDDEMDNKKMMEEENPMVENSYEDDYYPGENPDDHDVMFRNQKLLMQQRAAKKKEEELKKNKGKKIAKEAEQDPMMEEEADDVYAKVKEVCEGEGSDEEKSKMVLEMLGLSGGMSEGEDEPMEEAEEDPEEKDGSKSDVLEVDDEEEEEPKKESKSELASLRKWKAEKLKEEKIVNLIKESNLEPTKVFIKQLSAIDSKLWSEAIRDRRKVALVKSSVKPISSGLQSRSESSYKQFLESVLGK
jgi:hypothetical protein